MLGQLKIGAAKYTDGTENASPRGDNFGAALVHALYPTGYEAAMRGQTFVYHMASQAIILSATTGGHPTIINPAGSGVNWVPLSVTLGFISGTTTISSVNWGETANVGNGPATASALLTATLVAPRAASRVNAGAPKVLWSPTTNTFTAAPAVFAATGLNLGAAAPVGESLRATYPQVEWMVAPGNSVSLVCSVTTTTAVFAITIVGVEVPIV